MLKIATLTVGLIFGQHRISLLTPKKNEEALLVFNIYISLRDIIEFQPVT